MADGLPSAGTVQALSALVNIGAAPVWIAPVAWRTGAIADATSDLDTLGLLRAVRIGAASR